MTIESVAWEPVTAQALIDDLKSKPGALLPILHAIQDRFSFIPEEAVALIAQSLTLPCQVHGGISFYHHCTQQPGRHVVDLSRRSVSGTRFASTRSPCQSRSGVDYHQTTADRNITLEPVYCLGNCSCGPSIRVGDEIHADVDNPF
ncbi:NAD(P)H-dependent oxidoreductase subunit E [Marinomonas fungiae]|uniref:NAD(P)H-dependent oxidoreductase subunit E n=1 Tax=Marinomonas fungiae TaxID=1137284 RepID=UPI003A95B85F